MPKTALSLDLLDRLEKIVNETTSEVEKLDPDCVTVENFWPTLEELGWAINQARTLAAKQKRAQGSSD